MYISPQKFFEHFKKLCDYLKKEKETQYTKHRRFLDRILEENDFYISKKCAFKITKELLDIYKELQEEGKKGKILVMIHYKKEGIELFKFLEMEK